MLEYEMHGIQRLSARLYKSSEPFDMRNYNIPDYETLTCEPLHDICNHTKNLDHELSRHLPKNEKAKLNDIISTSFHSKGAKNSSDHRKSLLIVTNWLIQNLSESISQRSYQHLQRFKKSLMPLRKSTHALKYYA